MILGVEYYLQQLLPPGQLLAPQQKSSMQLVFGRDAILNIQHTADWNRIRKKTEVDQTKQHPRERKTDQVHIQCWRQDFDRN